MKPPASFCALRSEFDDFLFAAIREHYNGMPLTVVSALARLDLDPWHEAAGLAAVSVETATAKLSSLLDGLLDPTLKQLDPSTTTARLIALLPHPPASNARSPLAGVGAVMANHTQAWVSVILLALYLILMLGAQFALMRPSPPTHADTAQASTPPAASSHAPPTASGK